VEGSLKNRQLETWKGHFGKEYTDRNVIDWQKRQEAFDEALGGLSIQSILEVGCNRGHNLVALSKSFSAETQIVGIEPNQYAREIARRASAQIGVLYGNACDVPFKDGYFDAVFTAGVLIHIPPSDLPVALSEIYRVSKRYILAMEYFSEDEEVVAYRGHSDLLWKRDFLKCYQQSFEDLKLLRHGYWEKEKGFERTHWWLIEKVR
jgi:pseudaminic acid biosynthesis-associated methylase